MELLDALFKMEHGGDPNALLQVPFTLFQVMELVKKFTLIDTLSG
jgi:hypothetical protein